MKTIIIGLTLLMAVVSCKKSPENQVKENVKKNLTAKMDDPKSYESVSFGKIDSLFSPYEESEECIELRLKESKLAERLAELSDRIDITESIPVLKKILEESDEITKKRLDIVDLILINSIKYKGTFSGFQTKHTFRGKNKMGALILDSCTVILDKNLGVKFIK